MRAAFRFTPTAVKDLDDIWRYIAADSPRAADRVEQEIIDTCTRLASDPKIGTKRPHVTALPVRFWPVTTFPNYVVVYNPDAVPIRIVAIVQGKRNLKRVLKRRSP